MNQRAVLGRGLAALIPIPSAEPPRVGILTCSVHLIDPSPFQARQSIDTEKIESLAESVRERGVLQPLIVRKVGGRYQLIAGERRWRAAQKAGLAEVPILVKDWGDSDAMAVGLVENLQREDLNAIEEALAYQALIEEHQWTHDRLSQEVGRDRTTITNGLRLLKLPIEIQKMLVEGRLSEGHARPLLALEDKKGMIALAEQTIREGLSVRQVETLVRERVGPKRGKDKVASVKKDPYVRQLEEGWTRALGTKVAILPRGQGGTLQISYYSNADLERLGSKLLGKGN